jgi:hypothetical protein
MSRSQHLKGSSRPGRGNRTPLPCNVCWTSSGPSLRTVLILYTVVVKRHFPVLKDYGPHPRTKVVQFYYLLLDANCPMPRWFLCSQFPTITFGSQLLFKFIKLESIVVIFVLVGHPRCPRAKKKKKTPIHQWGPPPP